MYLSIQRTNYRINGPVNTHLISGPTVCAVLLISAEGIWIKVYLNQVLIGHFSNSVF